MYMYKINMRLHEYMYVYYTVASTWVYPGTRAAWLVIVLKLIVYSKQKKCYVSYYYACTINQDFQNIYWDGCNVHTGYLLYVKG